MLKWIKFIGLFLVVAALYIVPSYFLPFDQDYYDSLIKPNFTPYQSLFPYIWTILYLLLGLFTTIMILTPSKESKRFFNLLLILQYFFLQMYSYIQFGLKDLRLAFIDVLLVLITTFMLFLTGLTINKKAAYLIIPLLLWVIFASFLQLGFVKLNP